MKSKIFFKKYSLFVGLFVLGVIFWGAWVRLSLSGDGCGDSWPLCKQKFLPEGGRGWTEWIHRGTSGLAFLLVLSLWLLSLKVYSSGHIVRRLSLMAFALIIVEALIGAVLVLGGFVGLNADSWRVFILAFHLINSLLLTGALALCFQSSLWDGIQVKKPHIYFVPFFIVLAMTGNIASLAGQLFPSESLISALSLDLMPSAHISLRLRPLHPLLACLFVIALCRLSFSVRDMRAIAIAGFFTAGFGFFTLVSLSPLWMKMGHLILAYSFWIFLILFSFRQRRGVNLKSSEMGKKESPQRWEKKKALRDGKKRKPSEMGKKESPQSWEKKKVLRVGKKRKSSELGKKESPQSWEKKKVLA